ncbi:MAG: hypothetical protein WCG80_07330 [Spirochaetales bacterium]
MNRMLAVVVFVGCSLSPLASQDLPASDPTTLTVAPSDQVKYPEAKDILNPLPPPAPKVVPKAAPKAADKPVVPVVKVVPGGPLLASAPIPAVAPVAAKPVPLHGWFIVWSLSGSAEAVQTWVEGLQAAVPALPVKVSGKGAAWTVELGPVDAQSLDAAWAVPGARPRLIKK